LSGDPAGTKSLAVQIRSLLRRVARSLVPPIGSTWVKRELLGIASSAVPSVSRSGSPLPPRLGPRALQRPIPIWVDLTRSALEIIPLVSPTCIHHRRLTAPCQTPRAAAAGISTLISNCSGTRLSRSTSRRRAHRRSARGDCVAPVAVIVGLTVGLAVALPPSLVALTSPLCCADRGRLLRSRSGRAGPAGSTEDRPCD